uniref:RING-type E3 ubiquitin transferase n=1 Tax=Leersia perrieri TaxID=77586 RepID=A0A0D9UXF8_9ORYZ
MVSRRLQLVAALLLPLLAVVSSFDPFHRDAQPMGGAGGQGPFIPHEYVRFADVKRQCKSVLAAGTELTFDANRANALMPELSFVKADWNHAAAGDAPLMPFDATDLPEGAGGDAAAAHELLALASFSLTHVDGGGGGGAARTAMNVSGVLGVAVSRNGTSPEMGPYVSPEFKVWPGNTELKILLEGVYTENAGGERVLCFVGDAVLPSRRDGGGDPWDWAKHSDRDGFQPPVTRDGNVLLVIRYPKTLTLTTRAVNAELKSTNGKTHAAYFDAVKIASQLGAYSNYQFGSDELVATACKKYPYHDDILAAGDGVFYKGSAFCGMLDRFSSEDVLAVVPNYRCNTTYGAAACRRMGPFEVDKAVEATNGGFASVRVVMQEVRCEPRTVNGEITARVSAVFRAVPPWEHAYTAAKRSGLSGMTLSAEGTWHASSGQLCMVACLGVGDTSCHSRVCLYLQTTFSATRRSITVGQITRIDRSHGSVDYFPLTFQRTVHPSELWSRFGVSGGGAPLTMGYRYTKTKQAGEFLRRSEPFDFGAVIAKSLLSYPRKSGDVSDEKTSLSNLADELTLHVPAVPDPFPRGRFEKPFLQLEVLSLGSLVGRISPSPSSSFPGTPAAVNAVSSSSPPSSDATAVLNVSAELTISGDAYTNVSTIALEGVYNPVDGRMYLIGCRSITLPWKVFSSLTEVNDGMDCSVEVKVEYPPTTARWLINPTAKVHITSTRSVAVSGAGAGDPLHFNATALQTLPIMYRTQRQDILSRRSVEGILRIATLSAAIAAEFTQLMYIKSHTDVMPYVSVVMLGVQAVGYSVPLITGAEALFARISAAAAGDGGDGSTPLPPSYEVDKSQLYWTIDCIVKILILAAFLLTLRLVQKVWRSRIRLLTRSPLEPGRVPSDKKVLVYTTITHLAGFVVILTAHYISMLGRPVNAESTYMDSRGQAHVLREWAVTLEEYIGLAQDLFLLPQVIGNVVWRINCRPLKTGYYAGLTAVRLLPHMYDYVRAAPAINPYFAEEYEFVNTSLDFYSRFGDVAIPLAAVALAAAVYVQQRWNYKIISKTVKTQQKKLQHLGSRVYERLPSMSSANFEAELVSGVNEGAVAGLRRDASLS